MGREEEEGSEGQAEAGVQGVGWQGHEGRERETPTQRKRERREDNVSVGPGPPVTTCDWRPLLVLLSARPHMRGPEGMEGSEEFQPPALTEFIFFPRAWLCDSSSYPKACPSLFQLLCHSLGSC